MHQLVALAIFLVLTVGKSSAAVTPMQQLAYVVGAAISHVIIFLALQVVVYFGAKLAQPKETYASFTASRLNYLTLGLLIFIVAAQMKR